MNVEPPETFAIIESIVYKSNGFAIWWLFSARFVKLDWDAITLSAELLAAVDFGDAMSNPLDKNIDSLWAALDS